jgi:hypothetical protein
MSPLPPFTALAQVQTLTVLCWLTHACSDFAATSLDWALLHLLQFLCTGYPNMSLLKPSVGFYGELPNLWARGRLGSE